MLVERFAMTASANLADPVVELDRIRRQLSHMAEARRTWALTPHDEERWERLCELERSLLLMESVA
jgi:hypothetical protein